MRSFSSQASWTDSLVVQSVLPCFLGPCGVVHLSGALACPWTWAGSSKLRAESVLSPHWGFSQVAGAIVLTTLRRKLTHQPAPLPSLRLILFSSAPHFNFISLSLSLSGWTWYSLPNERLCAFSWFLKPGFSWSWWVYSPHQRETSRVIGLTSDLFPS